MLSEIPDMPADVIGVQAEGTVTVDDYRSVLEPAVRDADADGRKLRLVYSFPPSFDGFAAGAMWEDAKVGMGEWRSWERIAIVTDRDWLRGAVHAMGWMTPGDVRVWHDSELEQAVAWAGGHERP